LHWLESSELGYDESETEQAQKYSHSALVILVCDVVQVARDVFEQVRLDGADFAGSRVCGSSSGRVASALVLAKRKNGGDMFFSELILVCDVVQCVRGVFEQVRPMAKLRRR